MGPRVLGIFFPSFMTPFRRKKNWALFALFKLSIFRPISKGIWELIIMLCNPLWGAPVGMYVFKEMQKHYII